MRCAVYGCSVNNLKKSFNKEICFHSFPKDKKLCKQWVFFFGRSDKFNKDTARICSNHFDPNDYFKVNPLLLQIGIAVKAKRLRPNVVPSLLLPLKKQDKSSTPRSERLKKRKSANQIQADVELGKVLPQPPSDNEVFPHSALHIAADSNMEISTLDDFRTQSDSITHSDEQLQSEITKNISSYTPPKVIDSSTQTDSPSYEQLQSEIISLRKKNYKQGQIIKSMNESFTKCQIRKLECPAKRVKWSEEDISNAIAIHASGPRAYRLLLRKSYPLPAVITLKKWCANRGVSKKTKKNK